MDPYQEKIYSKILIRKTYTESKNFSKGNLLFPGDRVFCHLINRKDLFLEENKRIRNFFLKVRKNPRYFHKKSFNGIPKTFPFEISPGVLKPPKNRPSALSAFWRDLESSRSPNPLRFFPLSIRILFEIKNLKNIFLKDFLISHENIFGLILY